MQLDLTPILLELAKHTPEIITAVGAGITGLVAYFAGLHKPQPDYCKPKQPDQEP